MKVSDKPQLQKFAIEGVKHINPADALETIKKGEAVLIDVREENEVKLEYIPLENVLNHPMSVIMQRLPYIAKEQHIILGCPGGIRSSKVANLLNLQGYPNVANLDGGFTMWKAKGFPAESNINPVGGCGCGCNPLSGESKGDCC